MGCFHYLTRGVIDIIYFLRSVVANTLAYYDTATITTVKKSYGTGPRLQNTTLNLGLAYIFVSDIVVLSLSV
jgi:hypothetical protein